MAERVPIGREVLISCKYALEGCCQLDASPKGIVTGRAGHHVNASDLIADDYLCTVGWEPKAALTGTILTMEGIRP